MGINLEGQFNGGFFVLQFGGGGRGWGGGGLIIILRGFYMEGLDYFQNFTVCYKLTWLYV